MSAQKPVILLVHGAWHRPEAYRPFLDVLESKGYATVAPELPSGMEETPDDPLEADARHMTKTAQALIDDGKEVVVVAHSYGGAVVSEAFNGLGTRERKARGLAGSVQMIVLVAAFVFEQGKCFEDYAPVDTIPWNYYEGDMRLITPSIDAGPIFYNDIPAEEQRRLLSSLTKHHKACSFYAPKEPKYGEIDLAFVYYEQDNSFPLVAQHFMVDQIKKQGVSFKEASLNSGHFPMLSMPETLVEKIEQFNYSSDV